MESNFIELVRATAKECFNIDINIPITIKEMTNGYCANLEIHINGLNIFKPKPIELVFDKKLLDVSVDRQLDSIKHELIHLKLCLDSRIGIKSIYNTICPHGYYFIKEAKKHKEVTYDRYLNNFGFSTFKIILKIKRW